MLRDIANRADIEILIIAFYEKALEDDIIGHFFTDVVQLNLEKHIPKITDFWEMAILDRNVYQGNPMLVHIALDKLHAVEDRHFLRWVKLFHNTIDDLYVGDNANKAKLKANTMHKLMHYKITQSRDQNFIQ